MELNMVRMIRVLQIIPIFFIMISAVSIAQVNDSINIPTGSISLQLSPSDKVNESSGILGAELQYNVNRESQVNFGLHFGYQEQSYGDFSEGRFTLGISANKYFKYGKNKLINVGIKYLHYEGMGKNEDALDCTYCSDIKESYSGSNSFFTLGLNVSKLYLAIDYRITDKNSDWSENANDPYALGPSYNNEVPGIPDPNWVLNIGYLF
jgi:hypothetical protein